MFLSLSLSPSAESPSLPPALKIAEIVEIIEINPEDYSEKCEVSITDTKILDNSQVYHVKDDNTYEPVNVKESIEKIKAYTQENFLSTDENIYDNVDNLKYLYLVKDNVYIGEIENVNGDLLKIGIVINSTEKTYKVFYVEI